MRFRYILFITSLTVLFSSCVKKDLISEKPRLGGWDYDWMQKVKKDLNGGGEKFLPAYNQLIKEADEAFAGGVYSVTFKKLIPPSGNKHDYMSMGPYWWPDPEKPDGLPYIRRDGEINPERDNLDSSQKSKMTDAVRTLSLAWFFSGNMEYAKKAARLLSVWFLDPATFMNPHLEYAQAIPGRNPGRFIGVIDATSFHELVDAIAILEISGAISDKEKAGIYSWFKKYFRWLVESDYGRQEDNYKNNHSVAYDVQSSGIAYFVGDDEFAARKARELPRRRIDPMIAEDGSQPNELIRTKAFSYSVGNLSNFFNIGEKGLKLDVNIFHYVNENGGSIQKALDYLINYIGRENDWPYQQITSWVDTENRLGLLVRSAARIYKNENYQKLWEDIFYERLKSHWSLLVIPEFQKN